jgi:SPP1 family predicted phage head-tail adaptor
MSRRTTTSRLRYKMTLQSEVQTPDTAGGYTRSWQDIAELWAEITPLSGRERLVAMQLESNVTHRVLIRSRSGVSSGQRLINETIVLYIIYVSSLQNGERLELMTEERHL